MAGTTITKPGYNSSDETVLGFAAITTGDADSYIDIGGVVDGSKVILITAMESTSNSAGTTWYIGTSASAATGSSYARPFSGSGVNRMKIKQANRAKALANTHFRSTASTKLMTLSVLGPFETAQFKDSDNYVNFTKAITGSTLSYVAAILIP